MKTNPEIPGDFTLVQLEYDPNPRIAWYKYLLFPFWLFREFFRGFYIHIIKPDPPGWREKREHDNAKLDAMWDEVCKRR